ncbi:LrgB family protein [Pseudoflavonifractor sp. MSJ-37]|uniref:LrgB family protein n=1 Tax=Pseudoflavonifractor sp. MSJ-37 TaxID=2841531 RepID=UPI001C109334|nr:LrgB family protein [Pseudoflavonifractor sp. MSJ-37]MBU5435729.1 LrgB family protein [Pseudoflavonifractor sp. MSJ-37]
MSDLYELFASPFFGISLSVIAFWIGIRIQKKTGLVACNPLIIAIVLIVGVLLVFHIPYESYNVGGSLINLFLAPATACLAVSIYTRVELLKKNWLPILVGCAVGSVTSMGSVYGLCRLFRLDESITAALIPKSVTTPIAVSISGTHGGITSITVVAVILTGILGSILAPTLIRLFRVEDPMTAGLAIGACSHAVGTSKAIELGETEGAMSGLAIGMCGILTVVFSMLVM